ncbi:MAG: phenylalanine--tRNA ligase subunit alpha [Labilithrix sp.]|nr:phenylalanine--tRNA ligase subunit alpha [Labilithrix sp.]MBX3219904.1 phenylalanine--tRNA ligase subunit alpha [Labilithrix sp.]
MAAQTEPADPAANIDRALEGLRAGFAARFGAAPTEQALRDENAKILGKKGELTAILKELKDAPPDQRKKIGERVNALKQEVEAGFESCLRDLRKKARAAELDAPPFDLTLPERLPLADGGHRHPISRVREDVVNVFRQLGFAVFDGPEVEHEENNFGLLGYPPDHPATDMQDTFWTKGEAGKKLLLRSHTSNVQIRAMKAVKPPMAFIAPGTVYRRDDDATHSPMFHQIEAFLVDRNVTLAHLKGVLAEFAERIYGPGTPVRLRPSYFPFVEPGAEVDIGCVFCKKADGTRAGCSLCKHTGWIEILGCGMIHPVVFENCGIDPEEWSGFALGMGLERIAILRYGIPNIKLLFENDPRFLAQF